MTARRAFNARMSVTAFVMLVASVAVTAFLIGLLEHHYCTTAPAEVAKPDFGTPRYNWCAQERYLYPWLLTVVPPLAVLVVGLLTRRRMVLTLVFALLVVLAALLVATYPSKLDYAPLLNLLLPS
jgi:hypothetical protein